MNPARPGELAALSPSGTAADVDAAITAAAAAQPAWAALPAPSRGAILMAAGNLLLDRQTAIAEDLVREEGKTLAEAKGEVKRASDVLRFFGSLGWAATGEVLPSGLPDTTITTRREAARRRRAHHAVELPHRHPGVEVRPRADQRQRRGHQAGRAHPALRHPPRPRPAGRRAARRRVQRGARQGPRGGRRPGPRPAHRRAVLHRFDGGGPGPAGDPERPPRPGAAGDGRQERRPGPGRRRSPQGRQGGRRRRVRAHRPGLHRDVPRLRHPGHPRRVPRGADRGSRRLHPRRRHGRARMGAVVEPPAVRAEPGSGALRRRTRRRPAGAARTTATPPGRCSSRPPCSPNCRSTTPP